MYCLEIKIPYTQLLDHIQEYEFTENADFSTFHKIVKNFLEADPALTTSSQSKWQKKVERMNNYERPESI